MTAGSGADDFVKPQWQSDLIRIALIVIFPITITYLFIRTKAISLGTKLLLVAVVPFVIFLGVYMTVHKQPAGSNAAACFNMDMLQTGSGHLNKNPYHYEYPTGQAGSPVPSDVPSCPGFNSAPRQACIQTDSNDPANDTGDCGWNEKPFYWTDDDLTYGPNLTADQLANGQITPNQLNYWTNQ
jgi:hypothetical protein